MVYIGSHDLILLQKASFNQTLCLRKTLFWKHVLIITLPIKCIYMYAMYCVFSVVFRWYCHHLLFLMFLLLLTTKRIWLFVWVSIVEVSIAVCILFKFFSSNRFLSALHEIKKNWLFIRICIRMALNNSLIEIRGDELGSFRWSQSRRNESEATR